MADIDAIRGVAMDFGGTIDTDGRHWYYVIAEAYAACGVAVADDELRRAYVAAERAMEKQGPLPHDTTFNELMRRKIALQLDALHLTRGDEQLAAKIARRCTDRAAKAVERGRPALRAIAAKWPIVVVSNYYGNLERVLSDLGIREIVSGAVDSAVVGVRKPDPQIFAMAADALGLPPNDVLAVGDSLSNDIAPAHSIGMVTAWIENRGWLPTSAAPQPLSDTLILKSLDDLARKT